MFAHFLLAYVVVVVLAVLTASVVVGYLWCMNQVAEAARIEKRGMAETILLTAIAPLTVLYWAIELS